MMTAAGIALIAGSKLLQFALDSEPLLFIDSPEILLNGFHASQPERSYFLGGFIRLFIAPFHSLKPLVAAQVLAGAATAGMLLAVLRRYAQAPPFLAIAAAMLLSWDPTQIVHERLVMTECAAGLCGACFLANSLEYLRTRRSFWLAGLALWGLGLVSLRVVYIPIVWTAAFLLPLIAHFPDRGWRPLGRALLLSLLATLACQTAYRQLTGWLFRRPPAYHYRGGIFLLGNVASLIQPGDAASPEAADIIGAQNQTGIPLHDSSPAGRNQHLWGQGGLIDRLKVAFPAQADLNREAQSIALSAIRRDPVGFARLGLENLRACIELMGPVLEEQLSIEDGYNAAVQPSAAEWRFLNRHFDSPTPKSVWAVTPSRRYHLQGAPWMWIQLLSPLLGLVAVGIARAGNRPAIAWLALWSALLLALTFLSSPISLRYLHPLSFPGLALMAVLAQRLHEALGPKQQLAE